MTVPVVAIIWPPGTDQRGGTSGFARTTPALRARA